jgi:dTDP-4-dehydrorhamnose reductase
MKILYIGASGTLGNALVPLLQKIGEVDTPSRFYLDIEYYENVIRYNIDQKYDLIVLSAGEKNQGKIEKNGYLGLRSNISGAINILSRFPRTPIVYISTGYVYKGKGRYHTEEDGLLPCNRYAWSKLGGECAVRMLPDDEYLIVRCEFSVAPWHTNYAFIDQYTSREEVGIIANKIYNLIAKGARGTFNLGGKRQSVWRYALSIAKGKIFKCKIKDYATVPLPKDSSLNTNKYTRFIHDKTT